jgi:SAM-dependent methyltransferase
VSLFWFSYERLNDVFSTAAGSWLLDCMKNVPGSVEIYGIDIETRLFPAADCLPDNVHLSLNSVTNLPSEWSDTFTLINQRLLMLALRNHEWVIALKELHRVLAPKGWLQLCEIDPGSCKGPVAEKFNALLIALCDSKGFLVEIASQLPEMLLNAGFVNVHVDSRSTPLGKWAGKYGEDGRDNILSIWKGMKTAVMTAGGLGFVHSVEEYDEYLEDFKRELDGTPGRQIAWVSIYAQKSEY